MKTTLSLFLITILITPSCKKSNAPAKSGNASMVGFWTYKTNPNAPNNYWNDNALFNADGTFRMYTALSLDDTAAAKAIADTANQVVTFGTYTLSSSNVLKMNFTEFGALNMICTGSVNSSFTNFTGNLEIESDPNAASPLWILTKP